MSVIWMFLIMGCLTFMVQLPNVFDIIFNRHWMTEWRSYFIFVAMFVTVGARIPNLWCQNPLKIRIFWCSDFGWFGILMTGTKATTKAIVLYIQKWNQYIRIHDEDYLSGFGMVGLLGFRMPLGIQTNQHPNNVWPFKIWTSFVF